MSNSSGWRKSRRSNSEGACVEVAARMAAVAVRDSKDPDGPVLEFDAVAWQRFLSRTRQR